MAGAGAKLFTSGSILTAAQVNTYLMDQAVMRFATTSARDAAFGGAGEPTLAEGMTCYVDADDSLYIYNGTSWINQGSGLVLVSSTTIGSAVSSVTVSNAFSSTYDNYKVLISGGVGSASTIELRLTFGATATNYYYATYSIAFATGTASTTAGNNTTFIPAGGANTTSINSAMEIIAPNLAEQTYVYAQSMINDAIGWQSGYLANTTAYTAFTLTTSTGTLTGGTIKVYGYKN